MTETLPMETDVVHHVRSSQTMFEVEVQHHQLIHALYAQPDYIRTLAALFASLIVETVSEQAQKLVMTETLPMEMDAVHHVRSNQTIFEMEVQHRQLIHVLPALLDYRQMQQKHRVLLLEETANVQVLKLEMTEIQQVETDAVQAALSKLGQSEMEEPHHHLIHAAFALQDFTRTQAAQFVSRIVETANEQAQRLVMTETLPMETDVVHHVRSSQTMFEVEIQHHQLIHALYAQPDYIRTLAALFASLIVETVSEQAQKLVMTETLPMEMDAVHHVRSNQTIFEMEVQHRQLIHVLPALLDYRQMQQKHRVLLLEETANVQVPKLAMMEIQQVETDAVPAVLLRLEQFEMEEPHHHLIHAAFALQDFTRTQAAQFVSHIVEIQL